MLIISYTAALVAALAIGLIACRTDANRRQTAMDANYRHAYGEVLNAVQELDSSLQKSLYATTAAMECTVCTDIYSNAQTAEMALGVLPVNSHALARIARNIALAGDYARMLSRNAAEGKTFTSEELEHLRAFSDATTQLSTQLAALGQSLYDGAVTTTAHMRSTESLENLGLETDLSDTLEAELAALADSFEELSLPIAGGSYQVRTAADYAMLAGRGEVTEEQAQAAAAAFSGHGCGASAGDRPLGGRRTVLELCYRRRGRHVLYRGHGVRRGSAALLFLLRRRRTGAFHR